MKKLLIAALAFTFFSTGLFAQAVPAQKASVAKMQVVKKTTEKQPQTKVVAINKGNKPVLHATMTKTVAVSPTNTAPVKKDGTPDKRFKTNQSLVASGPVKKNGTPDMRYKTNQHTVAAVKKHK